jgi:hypothetical protein
MHDTTRSQPSSKNKIKRYRGHENNHVGNILYAPQWYMNAKISSLVVNM